MTIFGTRPEIIRLSLLMRILDQHCTHITVHTGQNYHESLSDIFIRDLEVRSPNIHLGIRSSNFADQASQILTGVDKALEEHKPDKVLILGDTNSALSAIVAARRGIPVFHMEAGNRCFDDRVPEEINRRIIDHSSTILLPYTERSKENLVAEGIDRDRIYVTGNPINEVLQGFSDKIESSHALEDFQVKAFEYFMVTLHRAENVDSEERLTKILDGFAAVTAKFGKEMLISVHPRTAEKIKKFGLTIDPKLRLLQPLGFFDFVKLEKNALAVLTDSGTVQEECAIFGVPNITVRDVTERPETLECGSNIISGAEPESIVRSMELAIAQPANWIPPREYLVPNTSQIVSKIILGTTSLRRHS
ncbi:MAG TPA: UDP-N-acetylglucosamine 2-epimerase (non-hydrolyzing) [Pyrinomonadaceae bacterium]|nr:UDP-N-acetylglucosamine 2-epimerase (non-hydrolyzing) [Pyrinomonadaceae bacterium]